MPAQTPAQRAEFLADVVTTALEGGIGYWSECSSYRWWFPGVEGGTDEPADGLATATAIIHVLDEGEAGEPPRRVVSTATVEAAYALLHRVRPDQAPVPLALFVRLLMAEVNGDAGELDASDADILVQLGLFGEVVYG